jgi:hypothetical protein
MCRVDERVYITAEGHRSKFEEAFPCDKARNGRLCPKVKKRTTEYYPKKGVYTRNDSPSPVNPPTPTGTGSYIVQPRRPSSSGGRPSTRDEPKAIKPEIIIEFGAKNNKSKKYVSLSTNTYKRSSLGATSIDDIAVESPSSDASHTIRTGYVETPLSPQASGYGYPDVVSRGYHNRNTSSTSSYAGSSRTPSLYITSDPDYESPTTSRPRLAPAIHNPSTFGAPSSPSRPRVQGGTSSSNYNLTVVTPHGHAQGPSSQEDFSHRDYHDFADRSASSHASSGVSEKPRRSKNHDQSRRKKDDDRIHQSESDREVADALDKEENIKQVRFELGRADDRAEQRGETLLAEKEKQRASIREESRTARKDREREEEARTARKDREREEKARTARKDRELEEEAARVRKERSKPVTSNSVTKRPAGSRRTSMSMTPAQVEQQRRLLAADLGHMEGESRAAEAREREERTTLLRQQQQDTSYYNPRTGGMPNNNSTLTRRDSLSRRGSVTADARPTGLGRTNSSRRASVVQPNPPPVNTQPPSARTRQPPPVSFPSNFNTRQVTSRRPSLSAQDNPFLATAPHASASNLQNPFAPTQPVLPPSNIVHQDPWDARNMREALPVHRQMPDGRYATQHRGEDVYKAASAHAAAQQATRSMERAAGYDYDYVTDSEDEVTHVHGRRRP